MNYRTNEKQFSSDRGQAAPPPPDEDARPIDDELRLLRDETGRVSKLAYTLKDRLVAGLVPERPTPCNEENVIPELSAPLIIALRKARDEATEAANVLIEIMDRLVL